MCIVHRFHSFLISKAFVNFLHLVWYFPITLFFMFIWFRGSTYLFSIPNMALSIRFIFRVVLSNLVATNAFWHTLISVTAGYILIWRGWPSPANQRFQQLPYTKSNLRLSGGRHCSGCHNLIPCRLSPDSIKIHQSLKGEGDATSLPRLHDEKSRARWTASRCAIVWQMRWAIVIK